VAGVRRDLGIDVIPVARIPLASAIMFVVEAGIFGGWGSA